MGKLDTIETIAAKVSDTSIVTTPKRCSYIRNWNSKCKQCLNVCQHEAISRSIGHLKIDPNACTNCGACVAACPTSTFNTTAPSMNELVRQARISAQRNDGIAVFCCTPHAVTKHINTENAVVLPCLNYLDEYLIIGLFAMGIHTVRILHIDCTGCKTDCSEPYVDTMLESTRNLMRLWKIPGALDVLDFVPTQLKLETSGHKGSSITSDRRGAFKQAGGSLLGMIMDAVDDTVGKVTGEQKPKEDPDKQVIVRIDEVFPPDSYRSVRLLHMLDHLGKRPYGSTIDTRFWATVSIDPNKCRYCGACSNMCVTRALKYSTDEQGLATLTFQPSLCIGCGLCKDSCLTRSLVYTTKVLADDLDADTVKYLYKDHEQPKRRNSFFS